MKYITGSRPPK
jgi:hypothetical protein